MRLNVYRYVEIVRNRLLFMDKRVKLMFKNMIFLYIRMFVIMCINLLAVRLLLQVLGETDYGIFNVVGGIVTMLSFLSSSMSSATMRFFSYNIGKGDNKNLRKLFSVSLMVYIGIIIISVLLAETGGLWFIYNKLLIPDSRFQAAFWVYQFSVVTFSLNMMSVPFMALIISSEKMNFYVLLSIFDAVLKLVIIGIVHYMDGDKLILYVALFTSISIANIVAYLLYVKACYRQVEIIPRWDTVCFRELFSYCSWYMYGSVSQLIKNQGINVLLNMFFNPVINAARGIAYQISSVMTTFVNSFYQAVRPQITKRYASGEIESMRSLVYQTTKMSYYLVLIISLPLLIILPEILSLWLIQVPDHTVLFTRLVIIATIIETLELPLNTAICSNGNIKWFQLVTGTIVIMNLPISYLFLKLGYSPQITMIVAIAIAVLAQIARILFAKLVFGLNIKEYLILISKLGMTSLIAIIVPLLVRWKLQDIFRLDLLIGYIAISLLYILIVIYLVGISTKERATLNYYVNSYIEKYRKK